MEYNGVRKFVSTLVCTAFLQYLDAKEFMSMNLLRVNATYLIDNFLRFFDR